MSDFENFDFEEEDLGSLLKKYAELQQAFNRFEELALAPQWEGVSIPNPKQILRFQHASEILRNLFPNPANVEISFTYPRPFLSSAGGCIRVHARGADNIAPMVFSSKEATLMASEFLKNVDDFDLSVTRSFSDSHIVLEINWTIYGTMHGEAESKLPEK